MGIKNPLRHSLFFTPWVMQLGKDSGSGRGENARSEHEQRPLFHFTPERSAPTVTLTAAVHVLTSLAMEYSVSNRGHYSTTGAKVKPFWRGRRGKAPAGRRACACRRGTPLALHGRHRGGGAVCFFRMGQPQLLAQLSPQSSAGS